jgi:hypothetical protein
MFWGFSIYLFFFSFFFFFLLFLFVMVLVFLDHGFKSIAILSPKQKMNMLLLALHFNSKGDFEVLVHNVTDCQCYNFK